MSCLKLLHPLEERTSIKNLKIFVGGLEKNARAEKNRVNYYPFGMTMPGRNSVGNPEYSNGYQGSEKDKEITGSNSHYTTYFRQLDTRIGKWWSVDPAQYIGSPYVSMGNNPVFFNDILGDTIGGVNKTSAQRMSSIINKTFDNELTNIFKLDNTGLNMESIDEQDFIDAVGGMTEDKKQLAYAYYKTINSTNMHQVEVVKRSEDLTDFSQQGFGFTNGQDVDDVAGGGVNARIPGTNTTLTLLVLDSKADIGDFRDAGYRNISITDYSIPGELMSHELLGHGVGAVIGSSKFHYHDAIQMSNLYLRSKGLSRWRDGGTHGKNPGETSLSMETANSIPKHFQIPLDMNLRIAPRFDMIPTISTRKSEIDQRINR